MKLRKENYDIQFNTNCHDNVIQFLFIVFFLLDHLLTHMLEL